jgi:hypothetical protein
MVPDREIEAMCACDDEPEHLVTALIAAANE